MKNFIQDGDVLTLTAPYDVASGAGFQVGNIFAVATSAALSAASVEGKLHGVFDLAKTSAQAWTVGDPIYWDNTNKVATNVAGGLKIGVAALAALNPSSTGRVKLLPASGQASAPASFSFSAAAGGANVSNVTITPRDAAGNALTGIRGLEIYLSDDAGGAGITASTASGTVQAKSGEGYVLSALTAKKHIKALTKAAGTFVLEITDTVKTGFYVCVLNPVTGQVHVSSQLVTGNYG